MRQFIVGLVLVATLGACAGRPPQPIALIQPMDRQMDCLAIAAEAQANKIWLPWRAERSRKMSRPA